MKGYAKRIKKLREDRGWLQKDVADKIGLKSQSSISQYEKGSREPDLATFEALADLFNVSLAYVTGKDENEQTDEVMEFREKYRRSPGMRTLFDVAEGATEAELEQYANVIKALRKTTYDD